MAEIFDNSEEEKEPHIIRAETLNPKSYLEYGFKDSKNKNNYHHSDVRNETESIKESQKDLTLVSNLERKALTYFSTENFDWINEATYENKKLPNVKGSKANFGEGEIETIITSVKEGEQFAENPYVTPKTERTYQAFTETVNTLDSALEKAPRRKTRLLYKGVNAGSGMGKSLTVQQWLTKEAKLGNTITFKGYQSTSESYETASETYARDNQSVIFEIRTPEGLNISSISSYPEEQEVLLPRNGRYIVVGRRDYVPRSRGRKTTIVQLVAVNEKNEVLNGRNHTPVQATEVKKKKWFSSSV